MVQYRINDLERLTGVKAHTIRIWEKRYNLISPSRSTTNRRFYSDTQLLKLMNVSTLLEHGHKISHLAAMTDEELVDQLDQLHKFPSGSTVCAAYIHDLTTAMVGFNEQAFTETFAAATTELGFFDGMMNVFYPFLRKAGLLWRTDKAVPIQEHFATCIIRNKIVIATETLPLAAPDAAKYMLFLPPNEWHEVALLFANYIIRSKGYATIYLGQSVPYEDIDVAIETANPEYIFTFFITPKPVEEIAVEILHLGTNYPNSKILISGDGTMLNQISITTDNVAYLKNVDELLGIL
ncbi:MerR family transcriptional regulator [Flavipsychrobacter stenotrophus]|uniref:MerR family transcriptional regulator n=1 Tax=Flavipsychrobacter stenotrophus TaxID=2077091 RepID=UPI00137520DF|nr:MerR family transcriptional regulator [Flavipsychrobacter stenotrophus]